MTQETTSSFWRKCSICKSPISLKQTYWVCNVSTCNRKRTGLVFCKVSCWDAHLPIMNHRDSWAEERTAPSTPVESSHSTSEDIPQRQEKSPEPQNPKENKPGESQNEILIVVSKLKAYINARSGMNTSASVLPILSDKVRQYCDDAIKRATMDGRQTVLERDVR